MKTILPSMRLCSPGALFGGELEVNNMSPLLKLSAIIWYPFDWFDGCSYVMLTNSGYYFLSLEDVELSTRGEQG